MPDQSGLPGTSGVSPGLPGVEGEGSQKFHKRSRNGNNSLVTVRKNLTRMWPLPGRDSPEREQREIPGPVCELFVETGLM